MTPVIDTETYYYCVGGRTALGISAPAPEHAGAAFDRRRVGLHHLCFRARERAERSSARRARIHGPGYYSVLFEDPDGIRVEINHVPGKGLLKDK
jgi:catechol 2,3-dioxygenase-like lactoylglutathione lyase family enzyme